MKALLPLVLLPFLSAPVPRQGEGGLSRALAAATKALEAGDLPKARVAIERVIERDPNSATSWELSERWAEKAGDRDQQVYALHRQLDLARAQKKDKAVLEALRARLLPLDPAASALDKLRTSYVERLTKLGETYEKAKRPHSAIRAYKQALALDPERADIAAIVERIAAAPDPSLATDARPRDLLEGISADWIKKHDEDHLEWRDRAKLEKPNYVTQTDAGYEVLIRTAEAMEQMNAFYRQFFHYGGPGDNRSPSRIFVNIYKTREEYTKDPKDWSDGHFTGGEVETYIPAGGFEEMTGTLFHEASHQFVSLAAGSAATWLNEGIASFFEGTRILANGTVKMNLPANGRLFPLVERMEHGWMKDVRDGIDPNEATTTPATAPTFRIVIEGEYTWAPPWYAPTWGVVFFIYNFQDPADGRFVYRKNFWDFVHASGGKQGRSAVSTFEELVLARPEPVTEGVQSSLALPRNIDELNQVWRDFIVNLRDKQTGRDKGLAPYKSWARNALKRGANDDALEFYEKGLESTPDDVELLKEFALFLNERKNEDRGSKLLTQAMAVVENTEPVDQDALGELDRLLRKSDPSYQRIEDVRAALVKETGALLERYLSEGLNLQAMDVAYHLGSELQAPELFDYYERGVRAEGHSIAAWRLAYNEENLDGWNSNGLETIFKPAGELLLSKFGTYSSGTNDYSILTLDEITSGDFSMEVELDAQYEKVNFAGLVFGRKSANDCHALVLFPPATGKNGFVNLVSFYGSGGADTWRRNPVSLDPEGADPTRSRSSTFFKLRIDVTGRLVDVWVNDEYQATQEFPSLDILRGSFGLVTGRGEARFRNVRFLARHPRDPSAAIERKLVIEEKSAGGQAINGSWLGQVAPFPTVQHWYQKPRKSWEEARGFPQLLVLWSTEQNDQVEIDAYLRSIAKKNEDLGLEVVNVLAFWNQDEAERYLQDHPFPGSVGLDTPTQAEHNFGVTFERYEVMRFHLPRMLLIDIDGRVAWEGDPGFARGETWSGEESLLDVPLRELIAKRALPEFVAWRRDWPAAREALARGDFAAALPVLKGADRFDATASEEVAEALGCRAAIEAAAAGAEDLAAKLAEEGREPALEVLFDWAADLGKPARKSKTITALLKGPNIAAWKKAPGLLKPVLPKVGKDEALVSAALEKIAALPGAFPAELAERARALADDAAGMKALADEVQALPARWLASEHFGW